MGGKNSVFNKPLGDTGDKVKKAVDDVVKKVPIVKDVHREVTGLKKNIDNEANRVWENNKEGVNATAGLAARGALAAYTFGGSELVGGGEYLTKQFGGAKKTSQYGATAGAIGGIYGASTGLSSLANSGAISSGVATGGKALAGSVIQQRAQGKAVDAKRTIASVGGAITADNGGGGSNMNSGNFWEDQWNNYGDQVVGGVLDSLLGSSQGGDSPRPVDDGNDKQPIVIQGGNGGNYEKPIMLLAGGLGIITLLVLFRK